MKKIVLTLLIGTTCPFSSLAQDNSATNNYGPENGSLIVAGGGSLIGTGIFEKFIELGGGAEEGRFVIVPTARGNRTRGGELRVFNENQTLSGWRRLGLKNVVMLHTHDPEIADTDSFIAPLLSATAVWFTGGRQWNLVDSYAGTKTHQAFHDVLARGGVIGGSSAGATILGDYLVRGDTSGSAIVMTDEENHQKGFEFLRLTAIDQHIDTRNRWDHLLPVIARNAELLGLGIAESTALFVKGDRFEVMGESVVVVHDNTKDYTEREKPYFTLSPGAVFNMQTRVVEKGQMSRISNRDLRYGPVRPHT
jgi:cyanophycinase